MVQSKRLKGKNTSDDDKYDIRRPLFEQSTGIKDNKAIFNQFLPILHKKDYYWKVIVVSIDIRNSSIALVNVEDFDTYQDTICDYICYIASTWRSKNISMKAVYIFLTNLQVMVLFSFWLYQILVKKNRIG